LSEVKYCKKIELNFYNVQLKNDVKLIHINQIMKYNQKEKAPHNKEIIKNCNTRKSKLTTRLSEHARVNAMVVLSIKVNQR
jgi:hypothetical protein